MQTPNQGQINRALRLAWQFSAIMAIGLIAIVIVCHTFGNMMLTPPIAEETRILLRSLFYLLAIITFPMTNLLRHIQITLNKTMPTATDDYFNEAKKRYFVTVLVSLSLMNSMGIYGLTLFMLGDGFNTLYIFVWMSALGIFLYRPKANELMDICGALSVKQPG